MSKRVTNDDLIKIRRAFLLEKMERIDAERLQFESDPCLSAFFDGQISIIDEIFEQEE